MFDHEQRAQPVGRLPCEGPANGVQVAVIHVIARGQIVHEAITGQVRPRKAKGCRFPEREVDHALGLDGVIVAIGEAGIGLELLQHRLGGDDVDHTARGVPAIERALGPAQRFDPFHIEEFSLEQGVVVERHIVQVNTDARIGRGGNSVDTDAADPEVEAAKIALGEVHVGDRLHEVRAAGELQLFKRALIESRNSDRNVLDRFLGFLGRHHHGAQRARGTGVLRFLGLGDGHCEGHGHRRNAQKEGGSRVECLFHIFPPGHALVFSGQAIAFPHGAFPFCGKCLNSHVTVTRGHLSTSYLLQSLFRSASVS